MPILDSLTMLFARFRPPQIFVADRDSEFYNNEVYSFLTTWGVISAFSEAYNLQANGQAEAAIQIVTRCLQTALYNIRMKGGTYIVTAYNCSPNCIMGLSPTK